MSWPSPRSLCAALALALLPLAGCVKKPAPSGQAACTSNADCGAGAVCVQGTCAPASVPECDTTMACEVDGDCATSRCQASGCCALPCQTDSDCPDDQTCHGNVCDDASGCMASADCPHDTAPVCDTSTGTCVQCVTNEECPAGQTCNSGACKSVTPMGGCTNDGQCATTALKHCDTSTTPGRCVGCLQDTDCSRDGSSVCDHEVCRTIRAKCQWDGDCNGNPSGPHCAASGQCVQCVRSDQCPVGEECQSNNTCAGATGCMSDSMCPPSKSHCRPTDHFCVECFLNSQCPTGANGTHEICRNGYCEPPVNGCVATSDCPPSLPVCNTQTRTCTTCLSNADCGAFCENQTCVPCMMDLDCQSMLLDPNRLFCDSNGRCVQCISDSECNDDTKVCYNGSCVTNPVNGPCQANGQCIHPDNVDLVCVPDGTSTGTCRTPCNVYGDGSECTGGTACGLISVQAGTPIGACVPRTPGASPLGGPCSASQACDVDGVCVPDGPNSAHCYNRCDPDAGQVNCGGGNKCQYLVELGASGTPVTLGACFPATTYNDPCTNSSQCGANQVCAESPDPSNPLTLRNSCVWKAGSGGPGAPCTHTSDCQSGVCLFGMPSGQGASGFCQGACTADSMCPARPDGKESGACEPYPVAWHDRYGQPDTVPLVTCAPQCRDNNECPSGMVCDPVPNSAGTAWVTRCRPKATSAGMKLGGALCYSDSDCLSSHCLTFGASATGICAGVCDPSTASSACDTNAQCPQGGVVLKAGPGPDGRYDTADDVFAPAPLCWGKSCSSNADCPPSSVCSETPDPSNQNQIVLSCIPKQGTVANGASCTLDTDCQSGVCITWNGGARCFGACNPSTGSTDCSGGSVCHTGAWLGTSQTLSYCAPP